MSINRIRVVFLNCGKYTKSLYHITIICSIIKSCIKKGSAGIGAFSDTLNRFVNICNEVQKWMDKNG